MSSLHFYLSLHSSQETEHFVFQTQQEYVIQLLAFLLIPCLCKGKRRNVWPLTNFRVFSLVAFTCKLTKECCACKLDLSTAIRVRNEDSWIYELAQTLYGSETQHAQKTHKHLPNGTTLICTLCMFLSLNNCRLLVHARFKPSLLLLPLNEVSDMHQVFMPAAPFLVFTSFSSPLPSTCV